MTSIRSVTCCLLLGLALSGCPGESSPPPPEATADAPSAMDAPSAVDAPGPTDETTEPTPAEPAAPSPTAGTTVSGTLTHDGLTMQIKGAVAVWDPEVPGVKVTLLPFAPTPEDIELLQADKWYALSDRDHGQPEFPDRCPIAALAVAWNFSKENVGDLEQASCHLYLGGIGRKGSNTNLNWGFGSFHELTLDGSYEAGGRLTLKTKGDDLGEGAVNWDIEWDFQFEGVVLPAIAD